MKDRVVEQIIDIAKQKGIEAEVFYVASQDTPIEFGNNRLISTILINHFYRFN